MVNMFGDEFGVWVTCTQCHNRPCANTWGNPEKICDLCKEENIIQEKEYKRVEAIKYKEKFNFIKENLPEDLIDKKFKNVLELNKLLKNKYNLSKVVKVGKSELVLDWVYKVGITKYKGYIYIYYTKGYRGFLVTEINIIDE